MLPTLINNKSHRTGALLLSAILCLWLGSIATSCTSGDKQGNTNQALDSLLLKGIEHTNALEFEQAYQSLSRVLEQAEQTGSTRHLILGYINMGALHTHFSNQSVALDYFLQSLEIARREKRPDYLNSIYNNLGIIYSDNGAYDKALDYFGKALKQSRQENDSARIGINLINTGIALNHMEREDDAQRLLEEAKLIFRALGDSTSLSAAYNDLGKVYREKGQNDKALSAFRAAYKLSSPQEQPWYRWEYALQLGRAQLERGATDSARYYAQQALNGFKATQNKSMLVEVHQLLSQLAERSGKLREALQHQRQIGAYKDSLLREKRVKWVNESQINYEFGKKNKELELLRAEARRKQLLWGVGTVVGLFILVLLVVIFRTTNNNLRQKNEILEKKKQVSELEIQRNQAVNDRLKQEIESQEKLNRLERQRLEEELELKNRALVSKALHLVNKNETLSELESALKNLQAISSRAEREKLLRSMQQQLRSEKSADEDWENFRIHFEEVHPDFFQQLQEQYPQLSQSDLRMCAYLKLGLSSKEIAQILNITADSVRKRKQRLREKIQENSTEDDIDWM